MARARARARAATQDLLQLGLLQAGCGAPQGAGPWGMPFFEQRGRLDPSSPAGGCKRTSMTYTSAHLTTGSSSTSLWSRSGDVLAAQSEDLRSREAVEVEHIGSVVTQSVIYTAVQAAPRLEL